LHKRCGIPAEPDWIMPAGDAGYTG